MTGSTPRRTKAVSLVFSVLLVTSMFVGFVSLGTQSVAAQESLPADVQFSDQETYDTITVDEVRLDSGGFVAVHDATGLQNGNVMSSVIGSSSYLEAGTHQDVEVIVTEPVTSTTDLSVMAHRDTNGNQTFDFVDSEGQYDAPYLDGNSEPITATATVESTFPLNWEDTSYTSNVADATAVDGDYVYAADNTADAIRVYDSSGTEVSTITDAGTYSEADTTHIAVGDGLLAVGQRTSNAPLAVYDVSDPANPTKLTVDAGSLWLAGVDIADDGTIYAVERDTSSSTSAPATLHAMSASSGSVSVDGSTELLASSTPEDFAVDGDNAVATVNEELYFADISDHTSMSVSSPLALSTDNSATTDMQVEVHDGTAFAVTGNDAAQLFSVDIASESVVGGPFDINLSGALDDTAISPNGETLAALSPSDLKMVSVVDPTTPEFDLSHTFNDSYAYSAVAMTDSTTAVTGERSASYAFDASQEPDVGGQVVDQNGNPISDVAVELYAVDEQAARDYLEGKVDDVDATIATLEKRLENPTPDAWSEFVGGTDDQNMPTDFQFDEDFASNLDDRTYVAPHTMGEWMNAEYSNYEYYTSGPIEPWREPALDKPTVVYDEQDLRDGESIVLSVWDASNTDGGLLGGQRVIDEDLRGSTVKSQEEITVKRLSPRIDETYDKEMTVETKHLYTDERLLGSDIQHYGAEIGYLNAGVWEIQHQTDGKTVTSYVIVNPENPYDEYRGEVKDILDDLQSRTDAERSQLEDMVVRKETMTDENGEFGVHGVDHLNEVHVAAYKHPFDDLDPHAGMDQVATRFEEMVGNLDMEGDPREQELAGSFYVQTQPVQTEVPNQNVQVEMYGAENPSLADLPSIMDWMEMANDIIDMEDWSDLQSQFQHEIDRWMNQTDSATVDRIIAQYESFFDANPQIEEQVRSHLEEVRDNPNVSLDDMSDSELISIMNNVIDSGTDVPWGEGGGDGNVTVGDDGVYVDWHIPIESGWISSVLDDFSALTITAQHSDGSTTPIDPEYYEIRDDGVYIEDYPLPENVSAASFKARIAGDGGWGSTTTDPVTKPDSSVPSIDSINLNTMAPSVGNPMSLSVSSEDTNYRGVADVRVYDSNGDELDVAVEDGEARFTPAEAGGHVVEIDVRNGDGEITTETTRLRVESSSPNWATSVRLGSGVTGNYIIAGDNVESASFERDGETAIVDALLSSSNTGVVKAYMDDLAGATDLDLNLYDSDGFALDGQRSVHVVTTQLNEDALTYTGDGPVHEDLRYGDREDRSESSIIKTYTDAEGKLSLSYNNNPDWLDSLRYRLDVMWENISIPLISLPFSVSPSGLVAGTADIAAPSTPLAA